jgi:hypothetical protein
MIFKARWKSKSRTIIVITMTIIISMWTNIATAGLYDVLIKAAEQGDINVVKSTINAGADVNAKMSDGMTSLMYASLGGHQDIVLVLLVKGADVKDKTNNGVSSLMYASLGGHLGIVRALIASGADINAKNNDGWTALMIASMGGHSEVVQELLVKGADVNAKSIYGWTALSIASTKAHKRVEELLKKAGTQVVNLPHTDKPDGETLQRVPAAHAEDVDLSLSARAPEPVAIPVIPPVAEPVAASAAPDRPTVPEPAQTDAPSSAPRSPTAAAKGLRQKSVIYTLLAGESVRRSKLAVLIKKLKASGLQPVVRKENTSMDVFRLVSECFSAKGAAQKRLTDLARKEKGAFIVHDAGQSCVVAASFFSHEAALTGQNRLAEKNLRTELVKTQVPLTTWQVTIGRYNDSQAAAAELKRLAKRGINVVLIPWDK